jgi:hypothetical protein
MSPAGISMFYGAFDEETARKESTPQTRHDGKGRFLIGQFKQKRPLQLIDQTALPRPSFWHQKKQTREALAFMRIFHNEITTCSFPQTDYTKPIDTFLVICYNFFIKQHMEFSYANQ